MLCGHVCHCALSVDRVTDNLTYTTCIPLRGSPMTDTPPNSADSYSRDLDLTGTIRPGLDILANEIVIALKKRSRFAQNPAVYRAGLVRGNPTVSLLDHTLESVERVHASLGRYTFATQDAFTDVSTVNPVILREPPTSGVHDIAVPVGSRIRDFYLQWIERSCRQGTEPDTYGETVTADTVALMAILERVNLGKPVAESKYQDLTRQFRECAGDRECMRTLLVRRDREHAVIDLAARLAERYELPADAVVPVFEFMIETTVDIELDYLEVRLDRDSRRESHTR